MANEINSSHTGPTDDPILSSRSSHPDLGSKPTEDQQNVSENLQSAMRSIEQEDFPAALDALNRAVIDAGPVQLAECFALRGYVRLKLQQFDLSEDDCTQSIQRRGDDPETLEWRAAARSEREDWLGVFQDLAAARLADHSSSGTWRSIMEGYLPAAEETFERRLQAGRNISETYNERGWVYLLAGQDQDAAKDFSAALKSNENCGSAIVGQARIALQNQELAESIRLASKAMQFDPDSLPNALACRAEAYGANGQLALAIEDVVRLREKVGGRIEGIMQCARLRSRLGDLSGAIDDLNIAHGMNPDLPTVLAMRGAVFAEMRNYEMARRDFVRYLKRMPGDERVWLQLGENHLKSGELDDARTAFDRALEIDGICAAAYVGRCKVMAELHNHAQGLIESERALRLDSRNPETYLLRGKVYHQQGRFTQAIAELEMAGKLAEDRQTQGQVCYLRGVCRYDDGNAHQAIEDFKEASRLRPTHAGTHIWRAATSAKLEDWADVIENLQRAIQLRPSAAQQYRKLGSPVAKKAIKHFDRLMSEGKSSPEIIRNRGRAHQFLGLHDKAINDYSVALNEQSEDYETKIARAQLYARHGNVESALSDLGKVIKRQPDNHRAFFARSHALMDEHQFDAALRDINRAIELSPGESRYHVLRGDLLLVENNLSQAVDDYTQAIVLDPADHLAFRKRGNCYHKMHQHLYAIADLTCSNELFPGLAETYILRGQAYLKNEQLDQANEDFEQALAIDPKQVRAFTGRASYLSQISRHEEALILLTKALQRFEGDARPIAELLMMRGKIFYQMGRFPPALTDFTMVIELQRDDKFSVAAARCARAVVLVQHGDLIRAKKEFDRVLKRFPDHPLAIRASKWLTDGNGSRPAILMPPERLIRPTRPPVTRDSVQLQPTDPKWNAGPPFDLWIVRTSRPREYGPVTKDMLDDWVRQGRIGSRTRLLRCGWEKWRKAKRVYPQLSSDSSRSSKRRRTKRPNKKTV